MLVMSGSFGLWQANVISGVFAAGSQRSHA
jgi:hypothetical protein